MRLRTRRQYRTAAGQIVGPLRKTPTGWFWLPDLGSWHPTGKHICNPTLNLIEEINP